jgi:signal transduction histidine kinase
VQLMRGDPISRFHPEFPLARYFVGADAKPAPVLEVLLPLHGGDAGKILGFAQYYIEARPLAAELAVVNRRIARLTTATLGVGALLIAVVVTAAYLGLRRAARQVEERNASLVRANFELSLAAKTSALGQITSHLIHGLQGPVAGLRAVVAGREGRDTKSADDWATAGHYAERMQAMIQEAVALLGDSAADAAFELSGHELAEIISKRGADAAKDKGVVFAVNGGFDGELDGHRGGLMCLIASNLVQNAIEATDAGRAVTVSLRNGDGRATVTVSDEGHGISDDVRSHLFEPGRSGRAGGSGLGLAISQLLARQIDATLALESTGAAGTTFRLTLPLAK